MAKQSRRESKRVKNRLAGLSTPRVRALRGIQEIIRLSCSQALTIKHEDQLKAP